MTSPTLAITRPEGRVYLHPAGHNPKLPCDFQPSLRPADFPYVSITTAIRRGMPKHLDNWIKFTTAEYAYSQLGEWITTGHDHGASGAIDRIAKASDRDRDHAGSQGDAAHEYFEERALGGGGSDWNRKACGDFAPVIDRFFDLWQPQCEFVEVTVFSETHGYAGTLDLIAYLPGVGLVLADLKTSRSGIWPEVALQLAAARFADYICYLGDDGVYRRVDIPDVVTGIAISVRPDEPIEFPEHPAVDVTVNDGPVLTLEGWQKKKKNWEQGLHVKPVTCDEEVFAVFLACLPVGSWSNVGKRSVIGDDIHPPEAIPTTNPTTDYDECRARVHSIIEMTKSDGDVKRSADLALVDLGRLWAESGIPTFGSSKGETPRHTYTSSDYRRIKQMLREVESRYELPFQVVRGRPKKTPAQVEISKASADFVPVDPPQVEATAERWKVLPPDLAARVNLTRLKEDIPALTSGGASKQHADRLAEILDIAEHIANERQEMTDFWVSVLDDHPEELAVLWAVAGSKEPPGGSLTEMELERFVALVRALADQQITATPGDEPPGVVEAMARDRATILERHWRTKTIARGVARWQAQRHGIASPASTAAAAASPLLFALTMEADPPESVLEALKSTGPAKASAAEKKAAASKKKSAKKTAAKK